MTIEFTDRYGGNLPSWLFACAGECEAMGYYPTQDRSEWPPNTPEPDDGWVFVKCPTCNGTGKCSAREAIKKIPRWFGQSLSFIRNAWRAKPDHFSWPGHFWLLVKCAWGYELILAFGEIRARVTR